ncbi:hypothetical protein DS2_15344 [Catenovulum agarivorans DS-2]|uniref:BNR repeat-containing family member n=1 Tax=Catenovulum agarivorans DS-2 TaxID=1328313 RepID=W7QA21_9ALTE|nr:BNR-4 repeat-containing protein [Catenovulum agarivorans]EWH08846.1 hypothetical protein DS2_15344 [Catenovulum agarivorans DS-2]
MKKLIKHVVPLFTVAIFSMLIGCKSIQQAPVIEEVEMVEYFADNALGTPVAVVQHPAGIHKDGITYVSYQGPLTDPYVAAYNHNTKQWQGPYQAGESDLGRLKSKRKKPDSHGKPTMLIDDLGYIHVFFGGHGGSREHGENLLGNYNSGRNKHVVSKRPGDISEWQELKNISVFGTYNQALKMDNGDIYLIYRHGAHRSDWVYQKSTDHGRTFAEPVSFLKHKPHEERDMHDSWYVWATRGQNDDIIMGYDYHYCWNGHPRGHIPERHDLYYMVFDTKNNSWRNVKSEPLSIPVTRQIADEKTLVARTGGDDMWTFNGTAHLAPNGYPHLSINVGKDTGQPWGGAKQTRYYSWTGKAWIGGHQVNNQLSQNRGSEGDFVIESNNKVKFTLAYQEKNNDAVVADFHSQNGGQSFSKGHELLRINGVSWSVSSLIQDAHPDARILVAAREKGTQWQKVYLLGDNGPIKRVKSEALVLNPQ